MNLALFGSGEFTPQVDDIDNYLIETFRPKNIAVIPTAAGKENDVTKWIDMATKHYTKYQLRVIPVPIYNKADANNKKLTDLVNDADWIFFSGGDPNYLFESIKDSLLWQNVTKRYESGALLAGSSAGAMIMGRYVLSSPFRVIFSNSDAVWQKAFNLLDYTIFPHFNMISKHKKILKKIILKSPDKVRSSWMGIEENTALILRSDNKIILGQGKVEIHRL